MGYCLAKGAECANKVVRKGFPTEAVGITAKVDDFIIRLLSTLRSRVHSAELRNSDDSLVYSKPTSAFIFTIEFLERVVSSKEKHLQHHVGQEEDSYWTQAAYPSNPRPTASNGEICLRCQDLRAICWWECLRDEEFAPTKNAEGAKDFTPSLQERSAGCTSDGSRPPEPQWDNEGAELNQIASPAAEGNNAEVETKGMEKVVVGGRRMFTTKSTPGGQEGAGPQNGKSFVPVHLC